MKITPIKTRIFKEGEGLVAFIVRNIPKLKDGSILVVASKIAALSEGRTASPKDKEKMIRAESEWALKTKYGNVTLKDGILMWNAGIDSSNADGKIILLPRDSFKTADMLRKKLRAHYKIKKLGIIITDSRIMPLRAGVVGIALGYAGFNGLRDYRGKYDIFDRKLAYTQTDIADSLATSATVLMGEGSERQPLVVIEDAPVVFRERVDAKELRIDRKIDMYKNLFKI
jgi:F420-0:gamma-glutamyl ligase